MSCIAIEGLLTLIENGWVPTPLHSKRRARLTDGQGNAVSLDQYDELTVFDARKTHAINAESYWAFRRYIKHVNKRRGI